MDLYPESRRRSILVVETEFEAGELATCIRPNYLLSGFFLAHKLAGSYISAERLPREISLTNRQLGQVARGLFQAAQTEQKPASLVAAHMAMRIVGYLD